MIHRGLGCSLSPPAPTRNTLNAPEGAITTPTGLAALRAALSSRYCGGRTTRAASTGRDVFGGGESAATDARLCREVSHRPCSFWSGIAAQLVASQAAVATTATAGAAVGQWQPGPRQHHQCYVPPRLAARRRIKRRRRRRRTARLLPRTQGPRIAVGIHTTTIICTPCDRVEWSNR